MEDDFDISKLRKSKPKRINSKAKGGRFERKVCEMLNKKFNTTDFCRTPGSGAFATTHNLPDHLKIYGDLITPKDFKFIIECKSGYNNEGIHSILNPSSELYRMIAQAERDSSKCFKNFLLIFGQDRKEPIVITDKFLPTPGYNCVIHHPDKEYYMTSLKDLLEISDSFFL
jgi:hypothetical protein